MGGNVRALLGGIRQPAPETHIANVADNRLLYRKAYLIEFYWTDENTPSNVFTFSLPPENEELAYSQRKTETKTFGGLRVDEYGVDAARIVLSGSTVNQSLKMIYRGRQRQQWLSGEEEIYLFRDLIKRHRSIAALQQATAGKIIVYDLSKNNSSKFNRGTNAAGNKVENYWRAFPGDFKITRSSDRPFTYKYSFEFTSVSLKEGRDFNSHVKPPELRESNMALIRRIANALLAAIRFADGVAAAFGEITAAIDDVLDMANEVSDLLRLLVHVMTHSVDTLVGLFGIGRSIGSVIDTMTGFVDGASAVVSGVDSVLSFPTSLERKMFSVAMDIQNAADRLVKATENLSDKWRETFKEGEDGMSQGVPREILDSLSMDPEEFMDSSSTELCRMENAAYETAAAAKSADVPDITLGNPDPTTGEQSIVLSYGYFGVKIKSTDTLESLAAEHMGDPDRAIDIATYNGVASLKDLRLGDVIRIPVTRRTGSVADNRIYARRGDRDNYGRDVALGGDGRIAASVSGDYETIGGERNLGQAILLRLRESVAKRIRLNTYGIRADVADPSIGAAYIISSIDLTVSGDPRVASVNDIRFTGEHDFLNVDVAFGDINGSGGRVAGRL